MAPFMPFTSEEMYQNLVRTVNSGAPDSVHLSDYPKPDVSRIDRPLLTAMAAAREIVALGRAARDRANIKVRQPLQRLYLRTPDPETARAVALVSDIIREELNVREVESVVDGQEFVEYSVRPNLPALGPRFGKQLPAIRDALLGMSAAEVASAVQQGLPIQILVDAETVELGADDVLVSVHERSGYAAMAANGFLVALDTRLTPELVREGLARETVRRINDWRKVAGFNIEDRIEIRYQAGDELASALAEHGPYIARETLADLLCAADPTGEYVGHAEWDGYVLDAGLTRSG
jgi:isoleucyl-tRNA synthetase